MFSYLWDIMVKYANQKKGFFFDPQILDKEKRMNTT